MGDKISAEDQATFAASLVLLAPPKQTKEVVKDVKVLVGENPFIEKKMLNALLEYAKQQSIQVQLPGSKLNSLVTEHGDLGGGRFLCPRSHRSFKLDLYTLDVLDVSPLEPNDGEGGSKDLESWRAAVEEALTGYMQRNYPEGAVSVFAPSDKKNPSLVVYIESSIQKSGLSGRWRSKWVVTMPGKISGATCKVAGEIKIQTHIYENGNVQLLSSKKFEFDVTASSPKTFAQDLRTKITESDSKYQSAIGKSLDEMSQKSVKALRRQLPMTHDKVDWNKLASYSVGNDLTRSISSITSSSTSAS